MDINMTILVEPTAKGRPRMAVVNGRARAYTPARTRSAEAQIIADIRHQLGDVQPITPGTPVKLTVTFYRPRPRSLPRRVEYPVTKPDTDNYLKLCLDSLNHYLLDDAQVTWIDARKRYAAAGEQPRIELSLTEDIES